MHTVTDVTGWPTYAEEHSGSKKKVWLLGSDGRRWLLKYPRPGTGEHWAEVVAARIAESLGIPRASVDLAVRSGEACTISPDFTRHDHLSVCELTLGNVLLATVIATYDQKAQKPPDHSVDAILALLAEKAIDPPTCSKAPEGISTAADFFVGYLLLDALIGNTDRHHENWGIVTRRWQDQVAGSRAFHTGGNVRTAFERVDVRLAPTFDHASSLGRDLDDSMRQRRLAAKDPRFTVEHYCARGRSPIYSREPTPRQLTVREAFAQAAKLRPGAAAAWRARLSSVSAGEADAAVDALPPEVATDSAREFAKAVLASNRTHLLTTPPTT